MRSTQIGHFNMDEFLNKFNLDKKKVIIAVVAFFVFFGFVATCVSSVGSNEGSTNADAKEHVVKPAQTEIKGDLKGYFEVVDKETPITPDMSAKIISIEIKRTEKELPFDRKDVTIFPDAKDSEKGHVAGFGIEVLDDKGNVIAKAEANSSPNSKDEMIAALQTLPGETATIKFRFFDDLSKASSYRILSVLEKNEKKEEEQSKADKLLDKAVDKAIDNADEIEEDIETAKEVVGVAKDIIDLL